MQATGRQLHASDRQPLIARVRLHPGPFVDRINVHTPSQISKQNTRAQWERSDKDALGAGAPTTRPTLRRDLPPAPLPPLALGKPDYSDASCDDPPTPPERPCDRRPVTAEPEYRAGRRRRADYAGSVATTALVLPIAVSTGTRSRSSASSTFVASSISCLALGTAHTRGTKRIPSA